jgi:hypothetical protein
MIQELDDIYTEICRRGQDPFPSQKLTNPNSGQLYTTRMIRDGKLTLLGLVAQPPGLVGPSGPGAPVDLG